MRTQSGALTAAMMKEYEAHMRQEERSKATIQKYMHAIQAFYAFLPADKHICKEVLLQYKASLQERYKSSSVNGKLVAIHGLLDFLGMPRCKVKLLRIQKKAFCDERDELSKEEYERLVAAALALHNERLMLLMQTLCATGIRVSEHRYVTVEALRAGQTNIRNKGKIRTIAFPLELRRMLLTYAKSQGIVQGALFITRTGKPLDRSTIWAMMKKLCGAAQVQPRKVFPHNLRHLFAVTFYSVEKDLAHLADILGHSSIETTRIYTKTSIGYCRKILDCMHLTFKPGVLLQTGLGVRIK